MLTSISTMRLDLDWSEDIELSITAIRDFLIGRGRDESRTGREIRQMVRWIEIGRAAAVGYCRRGAALRLGCGGGWPGP